MTAGRPVHVPPGLPRATNIHWDRGRFTRHRSVSSSYPYENQEILATRSLRGVGRRMSAELSHTVELNPTLAHKRCPQASPICAMIRVL